MQRRVWQSREMLNMKERSLSLPPCLQQSSCIRLGLWIVAPSPEKIVETFLHINQNKRGILWNIWNVWHATLRRVSLPG